MSARIASALPSDRITITTDAATEPFWVAAKERRLVAPRCAECGEFRLPPTPFCPQCQSTQVDWVQLSGRARIYSFAVVNGFPGLREITLVPAVVELPDAPGARLVSNVIDARPEDVEIGAELVVDFHPINGGWLMPVFRLAPGEEA